LGHRRFAAGAATLCDHAQVLPARQGPGWGAVCRADQPARKSAVHKGMHFLLQNMTYSNDLGGCAFLSFLRLHMLVAYL